MAAPAAPATPLLLSLVFLSFPFFPPGCSRPSVVTLFLARYLCFVCLAGKWIENAARPRNGLFSNPEPLSHMTETKSVKRLRRGYVLAFSVQLSLHQSRRTLEPGLSGPCCCRVAYLSLCRFILVGVRVGWQRFPLQRVRLANSSTSGCKGEEAQVTK